MDLSADGLAYLHGYRSEGPPELVEGHPSIFKTIAGGLYVDVQAYVDCIRSGSRIPGRSLGKSTSMDNAKFFKVDDRYRQQYSQQDIMNMIKQDHRSPHEDEEAILAKLGIHVKTELYAHQIKFLMGATSFEKSGCSVKYHNPGEVNHNRIFQVQGLPEAVSISPHGSVKVIPRIEPKVETATAGVLTDKTGSGKTLSLIALIAATMDQDLPPTHQGLALSPATLVLVPSHLVEQWVAQVLTHAPSLPVYKITGRRDYYRICNKARLFEKTILVVSTAVFNNKSIDLHDPSYDSYSSPQQAISNEREEIQYRPHSARPGLTTIAWRRLIIDEQHQIRLLSTRATLLIKTLVAKNKWAVTSSANQSATDMLGCMEFASINMNSSPDVHDLQNIFFQTNNLDLTTAPISEEVVYLDMLPIERGIYFSSTSCRGLMEGLRVCSSPRTSDTNFCETVEQALEQCSTRLEDRLNRTRQTLSSLETILHLNPTMEAEARIRNLRTTINNLQRSITFVKSIDASTKEECIICMEDMPSESVARVITPCGHTCCEKCESRALNRCYTCRQTYLSGSTFRVHSQQVSTDTFRGKVGTKMAALIERIQALSETGERCLVFASNDRQLHEIGNLIKSQSRKTAVLYCKGNVASRIKSIQTFKNTAGAAFLLSSQHTGSGVELTEATTVFMVDFHSMDKANIKSVERQCISRTFRMGQTNPVKVVRFIMRGTVEEEVYNRLDSDIASYFQG